MSLLKERWVAVSLMIVVLTLGSAVEAGAWGWGKKELDNEAIAMKFYHEVVRGGYKAVSTAELKKWLDEGKEMLVIDTMPYEKSYRKNHIPGAVQFEFPVEEKTSMSDEEKAKFAKLLGPDKDRLLVFYCGFTKCGRSHNGAMWAVKLGYTNVYRCPGGIVGWKEHDFPVEKVD